MCVFVFVAMCVRCEPSINHIINWPALVRNTYDLTRRDYSHGRVLCAIVGNILNGQRAAVSFRET